MDFSDNSALPSLFDRLPDGLFAPLASANHRRYWELLLALYDEFFGPEAAPPEGEGFPRRSLTLAIERLLLNSEHWEYDAADAEMVPDTPINVQSNILLTRLISSGWLKEGKAGVRVFFYMPTVVLKFFEGLRQFAEEGPQFVGGKVQSIYNNLRAAHDNPAQNAGALSEAAKEARRLIASLSSTMVRVREMIEILAKKETTSDFVRTFFEGYISSIFISDYHELRTSNHPLRHRGDIVRMAHDLRDGDPARRDAFISVYRNFTPGQDAAAAEARFERDIECFLRFRDIDAHLDRLNNSVTEATRRAISYLDYKLRTRDRFEQRLAQAIFVVLDAEAAGAEVSAPFAAGSLLAEERLKEPSIPVPPKPRIPMRRAVPTIQERALIEVRAVMIGNRTVSATALARYLGREMERRESATSDDFEIRDVRDLILFMSLASVINQFCRVSEYSKQQANEQPLIRALRGFKVSLLQGQLTQNKYVGLPRFGVERAKGSANG